MLLASPDKRRGAQGIQFLPNVAPSRGNNVGEASGFSDRLEVIFLLFENGLSSTKRCVDLWAQ